MLLDPNLQLYCDYTILYLLQEKRARPGIPYRKTFPHVLGYHEQSGCRQRALHFFFVVLAYFADLSQRLSWYRPFLIEASPKAVAKRRFHSGYFMISSDFKKTRTKKGLETIVRNQS